MGWSLFDALETKIYQAGETIECLKDLRLVASWEESPKETTTFETTIEESEIKTEESETTIEESEIKIEESEAITEESEIKTEESEAITEESEAKTNTSINETRPIEEEKTTDNEVTIEIPQFVSGCNSSLLGGRGMYVLIIIGLACISLASKKEQ